MLITAILTTILGGGRSVGLSAVVSGNAASPQRTLLLQRKVRRALFARDDTSSHTYLPKVTTQA